MNALPKATRIILVGILGALWLAGCGERISVELGREEDDPIYRRAKDLLDRGMENEALENYLKLIQKRSGAAPESHLDAGNIYLNHLRDPVSAIYHFKRYKSQISRVASPESEQKLGLVDDLIKTATKAFAASFDAKVYQDPLERLKLLDTIQELREENDVLKRELATTRQRLGAEGSQVRPAAADSAAAVTFVPSSAAPARVAPQRSEPARSEPAAAPRTYTIRSGDTLYKISKQVYGDAARWRELLEANREQIPDPGNLKVGATITIP